jgi:hypothetical protein
MTDLDQKQLGKTLWNIADTLRGAMNADDFRDYMLSFLFLRYLSDNYEAAAKKELGADYPDPNAIGNGGKTPLSVWYAGNPNDVAAFEKQMRRKVHYVVKPEFLWGNVVHLAKTQDGKLLTRCRRGSSLSRKNRSPGTSTGCSRRSISARTSSVASTTTATPSFVRSSQKSHAGWHFSRPMSTRWGMLTST